MKTIIYFIFSIFLLSCTSNEKGIPWDVRYKLYQDSIMKVDSIFKDSLRFVIGNEALGQIKFGMSKKQFAKAKIEFMDSVRSIVDDECYIGDTKFYGIYPEFNTKGELYQISVACPSVYELYEEGDIYDTSAFVSYLNKNYGLSEDDKNEKWIIGTTSFVRRPSNLSSKTKLVENPEWVEGSSRHEKYVNRFVLNCTIELVISNSKYID